jgi:hypothetical protein
MTCFTSLLLPWGISRTTRIIFGNISTLVLQVVPNTRLFWKTSHGTGIALPLFRASL